MAKRPGLTHPYLVGAPEREDRPECGCDWGVGGLSLSPPVTSTSVVVSAPPTGRQRTNQRLCRAPHVHPSKTRSAG